MTSGLDTYALYVIRLPKQPPERVAQYASTFRNLRLEALKESSESFTETYAEASARPMSHWHAQLSQHQGLLHMGFGLTPDQARHVPDNSQIDREDWILRHAIPLSMAINTGPIPRERFLCPPSSGIPSNRPDGEEVRVHSNMLYVVPEYRKLKNRQRLFEAMVLDRDYWLLDLLRSENPDCPPVARFRGAARQGRNQAALIQFYVKAGWYVAGSLVWRHAVLAESGEEGVRKAESRGDDMGKLLTIFEQFITVAHLEWRIAKNRVLVDNATSQAPMKQSSRL